MKKEGLKKKGIEVKKQKKKNSLSQVLNFYVLVNDRE